ncbi:MAG: hypothetical protein ACLP3B_07690 [Syntrophobacteraceae bacterium]
MAAKYMNLCKGGNNPHRFPQAEGTIRARLCLPLFLSDVRISAVDLFLFDGPVFEKTLE